LADIEEIKCRKREQQIGIILMISAIMAIIILSILGVIYRRFTWI